jgi:glutaredoxin
MIGVRPFAAMLLLLCAASAAAQQLYRWTDEKGAVHITDTPPPPSAKGVQRSKATTSAPATAEIPFELAQAMKDFPVTLYTSRNCATPCERARETLNKRGVPFKEVQVSNKESIEEFTRITGATEVPALVVGRSVQQGYQQEAFDVLLDSARYPRAGILPSRNQTAPKPAEERAAGAPKAEDEPKPAGPYAPRFSK